MIRRADVALAAALSLLAAGASAQDGLSIATGAEGGTYVAMGRDIARVAGEAGVAVEVRESAGSLQNLWAVRYTPGVQLGIVQNDLRAFLEARVDGTAPSDLDEAGRAELDRLLGSVKRVMALHTEELHLLASGDVASIEDLEGQLVAFGRSGGASFITAERVFSEAGVRVDVLADVPAEEAIGLLREGTIKAMVYVVGQPAALFRDGIALGDDVALLPLDVPSLRTRYEPATIRADSYPWLTEDVATLSVRSLLVSYDYENETNCRLIGEVAEAVRARLDRLRGEGHEKWLDVDPDAPVEGWAGYDCAGASGDTAGAAEADDAPGAPTPPAGGSIMDRLRGLR